MTFNFQCIQSVPHIVQQYLCFRFAWIRRNLKLYNFFIHSLRRRWNFSQTKYARANKRKKKKKRIPPSENFGRRSWLDSFFLNNIFLFRHSIQRIFFSLSVSSASRTVRFPSCSFLTDCFLLVQVFYLLGSQSIL